MSENGGQEVIDEREPAKGPAFGGAAQGSGREGRPTAGLEQPGPGGPTPRGPGGRHGPQHHLAQGCQIWTCQRRQGN